MKEPSLENNSLENHDLMPAGKVPTPEEFALFKKKVASLINLDLTHYKNNQMERRITSLMNRNNISNLVEYYKILSSDSRQLSEFINMLTINVTEFFRNPEKFVELETKYIPELMQKTQKLKIWSSGCSTGAEVYSIALILDKFGILDKCTLIASDFDQTAINKAKEGVFSSFEVKSVPNEYKKHFTPINDIEGRFQFNPQLISKIKFERRDLLNSRFETDFDLILCRNVVIYFTEEAKDALYENFYKSLKPDGILFIGSTERINKYKEQGFTLKSSFFYQK
ncbi:MAG: MCP methyltransferase, CheR-type [uncultured bacterium]|nr:MAG: MCP methyltransferase, CheR-type [uncultured bacterium]